MEKQDIQGRNKILEAKAIDIRLSIHWTPDNHAVLSAEVYKYGEMISCYLKRGTHKELRALYDSIASAGKAAKSFEDYEEVPCKDFSPITYLLYGGIKNPKKERKNKYTPIYNLVRMKLANLYKDLKNAKTSEMKKYLQTRIREIEASLYPVFPQRLLLSERKNGNIKVNENQLDWAINNVEGIAFYEIDPMEFLKLTTHKKEELDHIFEASRGANFFNTEDIQKDMMVHPFLEINPDGKVIGHEGRHRSASEIKSYSDGFSIVIVANDRDWPVLEYGSRWRRKLKLPEFLIGQYTKYKHKIDLNKIKYIKR